VRFIAASMTTATTKSEEEPPYSFPTTTTAPVVGQHNRNHSLVGFDPLLEEKKNQEPADGDNGHQADEVPLSPTVDVTAELRLIASQLEKDSPRPSPMNSPRRKLPWPKKGHRKTKSDTAAFEGIFRNSPHSPAATGNRSPFRKKLEHLSPTGKLPWQKKEQADPTKLERPTSISQRSLSDPPAPSSPTEVFSGGPSNQPQLEPVVARPPPPMIQELLTLPPLAETMNQEESLQAKPRPTSFLTAADNVRSSEQDASAWQLEIPARVDVLVCAKISEFLEVYKTEECLLDLNALAGIPRTDLARFSAGEETFATKSIAECHRPLVESLVECCPDMVEVKGLVAFSVGREVFVVERQRQLLVVMRGTDAEQQGGKFKPHHQPDTVHLSLGDGASPGVTVFADRYTAWKEMQAATTVLLDRLTDENPFCDVVFTAHGFGAAVATIAAFQYATAQPAMRVAAVCTNAPKVGLEDFRLAVHSQPNLRVVSVELGKGRSAYNIGHTIKIHPATGPLGMRTTHPSVKIYKFGGESQGGGVPLSFLSKGGKTTDYVNALEALPQNEWVADYCGEDGAGVRGNDNETREMS
jgi:hypothetical protein